MLRLHTNNGDEFEFDDTHGSWVGHEGLQIHRKEPCTVKQSERLPRRWWQAVGKLVEVERQSERKIDVFFIPLDNVKYLDEEAK